MNRLLIVAFGIAIPVLVSACAPGQAPKSKIGPPPLDSEPEVQVYDSGEVLTAGQTLHHDFIVRNTEDRPVRVLAVTARTPCCSGFDSPPKSIPAHGVAVFPVYFKVKADEGKRHLRFVVETDGRVDHHAFEWTATLVPEVECRPADSYTGRSLIGEPLSRRLLVICRSRGKTGRGAPTSVKTTSPLSANFDGPESATPGNRSITEVTRVVRVEFPPIDTASTQSGTLTLRWQGRPDLEIPMLREVVPPIRISPPGYVFHDPKPASVSLVLASADLPFRVLKVAGKSVEEADGLSKSPGRKCTLHLKLVPKGDGAMDDVLIETDHPRQKTLKFTVFRPRTD